MKIPDPVIFISSKALNKNNYRRALNFALLPLFLIIITLPSHAATKYTFATGKVIHWGNHSELKDVAVCTLPKSQVVYTSASGLYRIKLVQNTSYTLYFLKTGYEISNINFRTSNNEIHADHLLHPIDNSFTYIPSYAVYPIKPSNSEPAVLNTTSGFSIVQGQVSALIHGWKYTPDTTGIWDMEKSQMRQMDKCSIAIQGAKVYTKPASSTAYTDDFGLYTLEKVPKGVNYTVCVEKNGFVISGNSSTVKFSNDLHYMDIPMRSSGSGEPVFSVVYGEPAGAKYKHYAVISLQSPNIFFPLYVTINEDRALYLGDIYTNPLFISGDSIIRAGNDSSDVYTKTYNIVSLISKGVPASIASPKKIIVLCGEIEDASANLKRSSLRWIENEWGQPQASPDVRVSLYIPTEASGIKVTWPGKPTMTSKISMNSLNPFWDMRTDYTPSEGFRFKVSVDDIDISNDRKTTVQNLGSMEYIFTKNDIERGYASLSFGAVKRLIILLNDTHTKK